MMGWHGIFKVEYLDSKSNFECVINSIDCMIKESLVFFPQLSLRRMTFSSHSINSIQVPLHAALHLCDANVKAKAFQNLENALL